MKKFTLFILAAICFAGTSVNAQNHVCGNNQMWEQAIQIDPSLVLRRQQMEEQIDAYVKNQDMSRATDNDSVRIIPVVWHVIHEGGAENISDAQILDGMRVFNEDFRRKHADTIDTYPPFKAVAADAKIEFRMATKDPQGNCTSGINRVFSHRTNNFNDFAKVLIDWPSNKYLNIWVVKSIGIKLANGSRVIGYAQFPVSGPSSTDGVVLEHDFVGTIGTGQTFYAGRNGVHEIGHYLDLIHIWGDGVCGDDKCADTPQAEDQHFGCPAYPYYAVACDSSVCMTDNYMDYTDGSCKDIFTKDQKKRMRAALDVARFTLWQPSNLHATGTDTPYVYPPANCAPIANFAPFRKNICAGSTILFSDNSTGGAATAWNWSFPGGTPATSTLEKPLIKYNAAGLYDVTLTASNSAGSSTFMKSHVALVDYNNGVFNPAFSEGFEGGGIPWEWQTRNDDGGPGWQVTNRSAYSGDYSISIQNYETFSNTAPGSIKELMSPPINFLKTTAPTLSFRLSYGQQYANNADSLSVGYSFNCGLVWTELRHFNSDTMSLLSSGLQPGNFAPSNSQWALISLPLTNVVGRPSVRFRFYFKTDILSTNLYIDDININGVVGIGEQANSAFNFSANPNPANESFTVSYALMHQQDVVINLYDVQGRLVSELENKHQSPGVYEKKVDARSLNLSSGIYILKMITPEGIVSQKLVYTGN